MPLYRFFCLNCSTEGTNRYYDVLVPLEKIDSDIKCPECSQKLERIISAPYFVVR